VVRYYDREAGKRRYRSIYLGEEMIAELARIFHQAGRKSA
jgi:hypothetical protein